MEKKINNILSNYRIENSEIAKMNLDNLSNIGKGIHISRKYLQELRVVLRSGDFKDKLNEVKFFKEQKPYIHGRLKFYVKLYNFLPIDRWVV